MNRISVSVLTAAALLFATAVRSQPASAPASAPLSPQFDAASLKLLPPGTPSPDMDAVKALLSAPPAERASRLHAIVSGYGGREHGRYTFPYTTLKQLLGLAYRLPPEWISGPGWVDSERYSLAAVMPPETLDDQVRLMLRNLLMERLQLQLHLEDRETAAYALLVGKNGPKLTDTKAAAGSPFRFNTNNHNGAKSANFTSATMEGLARTLSLWADRPVVDMTGLAGAYDFMLEWSEDPGSAAPSAGTSMQAMMASTDPIGMLRSLTSVGLRAEARKVPLQFLIVDQGEKVPTEN